MIINMLKILKTMCHKYIRGHSILVFFITFNFFSSVDSKHVEISRGSNCVF